MSSHLYMFLGIAAGGAVLILFLRVARVYERRQERLAWGSDGDVAKADRREIHDAIKQGRAVGDRRLAAHAVRLGEQIESSIARTPGWLRDMPRWIQVFGLIFFPVLGTSALILGITGDDTDQVVDGIVLLAIASLYLPPTRRWTKARVERRERRLRASIEANRVLSANS